jgi:S-DNA-T family DNA segregation ATPase FtsK/SpoIIIE
MAGKKEKSGLVRFLKAVVRFFRDERFKIILGSFLVLFAAYTMIAFVSYFFTWKEDQDFLWEQIFSGPELIVENHAGKVGAWLSAVFINRWFGLGSLSFPFMFFVVGVNLLGITIFKTGRSLRNLLIGTILVSVLLGFIFGDSTAFLGSGPGGAHGFFIAQWLSSVIGKTGMAFLLIFLFLVYFLYSLHIPISFFIRKPKNPGDESAVAERDENSETLNLSTEQDLLFDEPPQENKEPAAEEETEDEKIIPPEREITDDANDLSLTIEENEGDDLDYHSSIEEDYDPTLDLSGYKYPPLSILKEYESGNPTVSNEELISNKNKIVETLANYKITIDKIKATIGPTVTLYEIVPAPGIRISKIKSLEDDIALSLSALGIRIIAPIPGKGTIGIEVPNQQPRTVSMKNVLSSAKFQDTKFDLPVALGKTISNETYVFDLTRMPHLLVAGATGQGKSVGLNAIITSLLYKKHPSQLKFVLVDPKKVELTLYSKLERHFLAKLPDTEEAIITDTQKVINTIKSLTIEMDTRYTLLKMAHVRNIKEYNEKFIKRKLNPEKGHRYLPFIVLVIDEFADLIMTAGRDIEGPIARLAQLARAIGIHLIIATQRPTTNIITGVIKANFPARIAFRVMSVIDSRTILDMSGANQLIGRGDMLISAGNEPVRLQCAFIDTPEIDELTAYIGEQRGYPGAFHLPEVEDSQSESVVVDLKKRDDKFEDAARLVVQFQQGSTSLIQRKLSLGYNRAGRIVDQLEAAGILGPFEGSKARDVLVHDENTLEQILNSLNQN